MKLRFRFHIEIDDDEDDFGRPDGAADHGGRRVETCRYRQNGRVRLSFREFGHTESAVEQAQAPDPSQLSRLRRLVSAEISRYRLSGLFSEKELRTIEALWTEGIALREHARREGVSAQAVEERIRGLRYRAVRFWRWWRLKNRMRARR
jgi:hypothetical protein